MRASLVLAGVCVSGAAFASPDVYLEVIDQGGAPRIAATVDDGPHGPASSIKLQADYDSHKLARATDIRDYARGDEPIALALVINGQELWIGNDDFETDNEARYPGVLHNLETALDRLDLPSMLPPGSTMSVISYSTGAEYKLRDAPISGFHAMVLGIQLDYRSKIGTDMVQGIQLGMSDLTHSSLPRKAMIVLGDGNDTNNDAAKAQLAELKKLAARQNIRTFAITYKSVVSADGSVITVFVPHAVTVNSVEGIAAAVSSSLEQLANRYYVTFDAGALPWDGRVHDLVLSIGGVEAEPVSLLLPAHDSGAPWWRSMWLLQLGIGLVLTGAWIGFARWRVHAVK